MTIEHNPLMFVKTLYQIRNEELADNLKKMKRFENANKRLSYKILNRRINQETKVTMKHLRMLVLKTFVLN